MNKIFTFAVLSFFLILCQASFGQTPPASSFGGFQYDQGKLHDELTPAQRQAIQEQLQSNISDLKRKGIIPENQKKGTEEVKFILPLRQAPGFTDPGFYAIYNFVDTALNSSQIKDYNCGNRTYDGHMGTDFITFPFGWQKKDEDAVEVVAAAEGVIIYKYDQKVDTICVNCTPQSPADCWIWNAVYVQSADGTICWYGHMKTGSATTKAVGETVAQGEYLGIVGSSGNSSVPHLHFEVWKDNKLLDPFAGNCNINGAGTASMWVNQEPYYSPGINKIATASAQPVLYTCYENGNGEKPNYKNTFVIGDTVYFSVYARDNVPGGEPYKLKITKPSGATLFNWQLAPYPTFYASVYFNYNFDATYINEPGEWKFEVTLNGKTATHRFNVTAALPVTLLSFTAAKKTGAVQLDWQTAEEQNADYFRIERSGDGENFTSIGRVYVKGASAAGINAYRYTDVNPLPGDNFYRLAMVDKNGSFKNSDVERISFSSENIISLFPNPSARTVTVKGIQEYIYLKVTDMHGKKLIEKTIRQDAETIDISSLPNDIYLIELTGKNKRKVLKLMKQD